MIHYEAMPKSIADKRTAWGSERDVFLDKAKREEERYYNDVENTGTGFTKKQLKDIEEKGSNIPLSLNFLYPKISQKLAILSKTKPSFRAVGLDDRGKKYAEVIDKAVKSVLYRSEAQGEEKETIKNMLIMGMGINTIEELDHYEFGHFNIAYTNTHPSMVVLDANARKKSLADMSGYFIEKEITLEEAKDKYSDLIDKVNEYRRNKGEDGDITLETIAYSTKFGVKGQGRLKVNDTDNPKITVSEYFDRKYTIMYFIKNADTGNIERKFEENLEEDEKFILEKPEDAENGLFVRRKLFLGDYFLYEEMKPLRDYPLKVKFFDWGGSPYKCYGMIHHTLGMQEAADKATQLMLINGMLTNNAGYISPSGSVSKHNKKNWEFLGNKPGIMKEYEPVIIDGILMKPEREQIQQLSNFYPTIISMSSNAIKDSTGISAVVTGDAQEAKVDVFSSLKQYQSAAMERIQMTMAEINLANQHLGNVVLDYLVANIGVEQKYGFFDDKGKYNEIAILKEEAENFSMGRYKILSIAAEASPTERLAQATALFNAAQTAQDPIEKRIYIKKAFSLTDSRGFDEIQDDIDIGKRLQQQTQQLEAQVKRLNEINKQLENRVINAEIKAKIAGKISDALTSEEVSKIKEDYSNINNENENT